MGSRRWAGAAFLAVGTALAGPAWAGEGSPGFVPACPDGSCRVDSDLEAMKRRLEEQDRRIRELEGSAMTADEVASRVDRYLASAPAVVMVGGADDPKGEAGFKSGKKPFIKQGPNKLEVGLRFQVRYSSFRYEDDAVGTLKAPNVVDDAAPRDRSGFELERMYVVFEGSVFCEDITYKLELNFDSDSSTGLEKNYAYLDWKYAGEHHVRAGSDKVPYSIEENNSSSALAFVDRSIVTKGFEVGFSTGVSLWGYFGSCDCPKQFLYKVQAGNGEGRMNQEGSVFNIGAVDEYSDQLLYAGMFEWVVTCDEYKLDEVDHRPCDKRCAWQVAIGAAGYYENDDDLRHFAPGGIRLAGGSARIDRMGLEAWVRAAWNGFTFLADAYYREIDYTGDSDAETQTDYGVQFLAHYRFADSNWGVGLRGGAIWLDDDYDVRTVGSGAAAVDVPLEDTIYEVGAVVNYFFWDHNHKLSLDVNRVIENSAVSSSSAGYRVDPATGIVVEDGWYFRIQWQLSL
jgi:hypothetical protein